MAWRASAVNAHGRLRRSGLRRAARKAPQSPGSKGDLGEHRTGAAGLRGFPNLLDVSPLRGKDRNTYFQSSVDQDKLLIMFDSNAPSYQIILPSHHPLTGLLDRDQWHIQ